MSRCTVADHRTTCSGSLALDLLEHQATIEILLAYHATISSALARCPSTELRQLLDETVARLASTFAAIERVLDAYEYADVQATTDTVKAWRSSIERLKHRYHIEPATVRPRHVRPAPRQPASVAA